MKQLVLYTLLFIMALPSFSQNRKDFAVSVSAGIFNTPYYKDAKAKAFYNFGFDYHLAKRHLLSVNYLTGKHRYFDDVLSNEPTGGTQSNGTNSDAEYRSFSVSYKYRIIDNDFVSIVPGVGAGIVTHTRQYPYSEVNKSYPRISTWSDLIFPVNLDVNFKITRNWQAGLTSGFLIHPDFPVIGLHAGPKLSYVID